MSDEKRSEMKIQIQGFWGAEIKSMQPAPGLTLEKHIEGNDHIIVCQIVIDGYMGSVGWNGSEFFISDQGTVGGKAK